MIGQRLRLTTSRPAGYRRGGQVIGNAGAPTLVAPGDTTPQQLLALLTDPNVSIDIETKEGGFYRLSRDERTVISQLLAEEELKAMGLLTGGEDLTALRAADLLPPLEPDTAEPQGEGTVPDAEASQAGGTDVTVDASAGSAADAGTNAPVQPEAAVPAPEKPAPAKPNRSGKRKTAAT